MKIALLFLLILPALAREGREENNNEHRGRWSQSPQPQPRAQKSEAVAQNPARVVTPGVPTRTRVIVPRNQQRVPEAPRRGEKRRDEQAHQREEQRAQQREQQREQRRAETDKRVPADRVPGRHHDVERRDRDERQARPPRRVWEQPSHPPGKIEDRRQAKAPDRDDQGHRIEAKPWKKAPDHTTIVNNPTIVKNITIYNQNETVVNHYYWHRDGGVRYCHYWDGGVHWYGWYVGPRYYWTRWYANSWWWYDPAYARWLWWDDGYWWWRDRAVTYVYVDGSYTSYNDAAAAVPAVAAPASADNGDAYYSPDGSRLVQIYGERNEAFLYARYAGEEPEFLTFLGRDVKKVDFSDTKDPDKLQILLTFKDGHLEVLDNRGSRQN